MSEPAHVQPVVEVQPLEWGAYDVPRIWDAVRHEDDFLAWEQVKGFEHLAQLIDEQVTRLRGLRETLTTSWDPATHPAVASCVATFSDLVHSLEQDAIAHRSTSRALYAILTTLKAARERIGLLKREWDQVTTDWIPQWWDHQAEDLNRRARHVIRQAEEAIADHRRRLLVAPGYAHGDTSGELKRGEAQPARRRVLPPPPVPGYNPVPPQADPVDTAEPQAAGGLRSVPAVPGSPISLLPVPPGNPYAPGGGAYVLPGPGIGRGGWIYPMPRQGQRAGHMVWDAAQGVPPIVGGSASAAPVPDDGFLDWFSALAMPWTAEP